MRVSFIGMAYIAFVDENDNVIGAGTKQEATQNGIIHRVVRVFLTNSKGEILLQKRAEHIIASPGKWDHSVGGHVDEGETYDEAVKREMHEEIGVRNVPLVEVAKYYRDETDGGRVKKRFNVLYTGAYDGAINFDPDEVQDVQWIAPVELEAWMAERPQDFTRGCLYAYTKFKEYHEREMRT